MKVGRIVDDVGGKLISVADNVVVECHGHTIAADILKPAQVFQGSRLRRCLSRVECTTFGGDLNSCDEP